MGACLGCFRTEATPPRRSPTAELDVVPGGRRNVAEEETYTYRIPYTVTDHGPEIIHGQHPLPTIRRSRSTSLDLPRQRSRVTKNKTATFPFRKRPKEHSMDE